MQDFTELYTLLGACYFSLKRSASSALNQGSTRGLSIDDVVLIQAFNEDDELTIQELAGRTGRDMASVSRQVTSLVAHRWISKRKATEDARVRYVSPTHRAHSVMPKASQYVGDVYEAMLEKLSLTERNELARMLQTILSLATAE